MFVLVFMAQFIIDESISHGLCLCHERCSHFYPLLLGVYVWKNTEYIGLSDTVYFSSTVISVCCGLAFMGKWERGVSNVGLLS